MLKFERKLGVLAIVAVFFLFACGGGGGGTGSGGTGGDGGYNDDNDGGNTDNPQSYVLEGLGASFYKGSQDPNVSDRVPEKQVIDGLKTVKPYTKSVRSWGSTLGMEVFPKLAREMGFRVAAGAWLGKNLDANLREIKQLAESANDGHVDIAIIGSEVVYREDLTVSQIVGYINMFRELAPGVKVTTAEVYDVWLAHPELIDAVDVIFSNYYPYWEGISIENAMAFVHSRHRKVQALAGEKEVVVSETGWPSGGNTIGDAVPSPENAALYFLNFVSWARFVGADYYYFEAFDEPWKALYEGPQGKRWGIFDEKWELKPGMERVFNNEEMPNNWESADVPGGPGEPEIEITHLPPKGSDENLKGRVLHVDPDEYKIIVYIQAWVGWWTKPYFNSPYTELDKKGKFETDITTGGVDSSASQIAVFLIPYEYNAPAVGGGNIPEEVYAHAVAYVILKR